MKRAITYGRFNYLSKGHINFFETILKKWDELYIIVLVNGNVANDINFYDNKTNDFIELCNKNVNKKDLLPDSIRLDALSLAIKNNKNLLGKVHISAMCRPEINVNQFNESYPEKYFDMVFPNDDSNMWDSLKKEMFSKVFFRNIYTVTPDFFTHNTTIIKNNSYKKYLDPSAYNYYINNSVDFK